jgi:excinuclease ABC subunit C
LLQHVVEDLDVIEAWLGSERRGVVKLLAPKRGARRQLIEVVAENARQGVQLLQMKQDRDAAVTGTALLELKELMSLPSIPSRIEGYDISNIQGALATGSMVVFEDGAPRPSLYRRFRIKTVVGANDYAMLGEVLRRRFARARTGESTWSVLPGLILIDGGKGQLSAALLAMKESGFWLPVAGLAKEHEEVFLPGAVKPLSFPPASPARRLLQRVRDEAHRFALGYHVNLRQRQSIASVLDSVPGIGAKRRKALIRRFGSLRGVKAATLAELRQVPGINPDLAATIKDYLAQ